MSNPVEVWKTEKHGLDVWPDVQRYAANRTPMTDIETPELERMKWHGFFYRKRDKPGRYMNRIRITGSELTAVQAKEVARIAYEYGHGIVDVTTRANLQVQGLEIKNLPRVAERLEAVGLTSRQTGHDNIRNVFAHPYSGLLPDELWDTRELCRAVTALFLDNREFSDLPRKFNICLNGTSQHSAHFWTQDISFLAHRDLGEEVSFHVLIGGTQGQNPRLAWHLPVVVTPEQVVPVTRVLLQLFRAQGSRGKRNRARFRYLIERIGIGGVLEYIEEHLPTQLVPSPVPPPPSSRYDDLIGWFCQSDPSLWTMGLCVPLGRMTWKQLEGLGVLSERWGDGQLRTTHEQGIALANVASGFRDAAATGAAALGLSVHADPLDRNTMACTGNQFCNIAVTETKGSMLHLIDKLRRRSLMLHGIRIHMSGCPSSCAQHFTADIGLKGVRVRRLLGTREGFDVYLGGGIAGHIEMGMPYRLGVDIDQLPNLIEEVIQEYYLRHRPGQTFSSYWRERIENQKAEKVGDEAYSPPTWLCEGCQYRHVAEDPPVFCPSCAGLRRLFARIEDGSNEFESSIPSATVPENSTTRDDGFVLAAPLEDVPFDSGLAVSVNGHQIALFRTNGGVSAIDNECPHAGGSLAEGEIGDGVVTCPLHGWTFGCLDGCSVEPKGHEVRSYEILIEESQVYVRVHPDRKRKTA